MTTPVEIYSKIGAVEAKVDILLERTTGFDTRLSVVERKVWWMTGVSAVLAFIATTLFGKH